MKEIFEFRINYDFATELFDINEGKDIGQLSKSIKVIRISKDDPRFHRIHLIDKNIKAKFGRAFYFGWRIIRTYSKSEINDSKLFNVKIPSVFEPSGEECGTKYSEKNSCKICGANREIEGFLVLKAETIPKKDIAKTIGGEVIVSERFLSGLNEFELKGILIKQVTFVKPTATKYYQLLADEELKLSDRTIGGIDPFNLSSQSDGEIYKCPLGHTLGLNILSEAFICKANSLIKLDFFKTSQKFGVRRGLLQPEPIYLCSQKFRRMVEVNGLKGFEFEVAHITH